MFDNCFIVGKKNYVNELKIKLKEVFVTVENGRLRKMLGVRNEWKHDEQGELLLQ